MHRIAANSANRKVLLLLKFLQLHFAAADFFALSLYYFLLRRAFGFFGPIIRKAQSLARKNCIARAVRTAAAGVRGIASVKVYLNFHRGLLALGRCAISARVAGRAYSQNFSVRPNFCRTRNFCFSALCPFRRVMFIAARNTHLARNIYLERRTCASSKNVRRAMCGAPGNGKSARRLGARILRRRIGIAERGGRPPETYPARQYANTPIYRYTDTPVHWRAVKPCSCRVVKL